MHGNKQSDARQRKLSLRNIVDFHLAKNASASEMREQLSGIFSSKIQSGEDNVPQSFEFWMLEFGPKSRSVQHNMLKGKDEHG